MAQKSLQENISEVYRKATAPSTCLEVYSLEDRAVVTLKSGIKVMCDTKSEGGGWTIFQRRINGKLTFYRGWKEYRDGFEDATFEEFYLGNENIFMLTSRRRYELRIDMEYKNKKYFARYSSFRLLGEEDKYRLLVGNYSGNAGNSLRRENNTDFTTFDHDNDKYKQNCANLRLGAWWYTDCSDSNLNGNWGNNDTNGVYWDTLGVWDSVTFTEMKIRETK